MATGKNARAALIKAMADIVSKVVQDRQLHLALLKTDEPFEQPNAEARTSEEQ